MLVIQNQNIAVSCEESGRHLTIHDKKRNMAWVLEEHTLVYAAADDVKGYFGEDSCPKSMSMLKAELAGSSLKIGLKAGENTLSMVYTLKDDYVEISHGHQTWHDIGFISMPGSFAPEEGNLKLLLPIMQGMLWDGKGPAFSQIRGEAHHQGFSMPLIGYMGGKGGLLLTAETRDDVFWSFGKSEEGRIWAQNLQTSSLGDLGYERIVRLYPTEPDVTCMAKTYRRKVIGQGRFKSWEEKLRERPGLERLFGALMCFIGYVQDDIDYVRELKKLKEFGFNRCFVYPGRFNTPDEIRMGGSRTINLSPGEIEEIKALGYDMAPWTWIGEAIGPQRKDGLSSFRVDRKGGFVKGWSIDEQTWYRFCDLTLPEIYQESLRNRIQDMTWDHFDVLACAQVDECYSLDHTGHRGFPLTRSMDREGIRNAFKLCREKGRVVSAENFNDAFSLEYDIGSVKALPQYGPWIFWPVPLTMLVYHDSIMHIWWELHSYNDTWRGFTGWSKYFEHGGGEVKKMAALDALTGSQPHVFPFGAQYSFSGTDMTSPSFLYKYRFEDPIVQFSLKEALEVARLHKRIGKLEMVHFKILSEDGNVQETAFADGTRVVANFARDVRDGTDGVRWIQPLSWVATQ